MRGAVLFTTIPLPGEEFLLEVYSSFDENGIHGNADSPLTAETFRRLGFALGGLVRNGGKFLVSCDSPTVFPDPFPKFVDGLRSSGMSVVNLGSLPTPMVYYAARRTHADGCAAICVPNGNGSPFTLKWLIGETVPDAEQVDVLKKTVENGEEKAVNGAPEMRSLDVTYDYVAWLQDTWFDSPGMKAQVVLDTCGGPWSGRARRYLQAVFPKLVFTELGNDEEPTQTIAEEVDRTRAHLGFILGKDGGQLSVVDGYGIPYDPAELNWLLIQSFGLSLQGEVFLHDSLCPPAILQSAVRFGAATQEVSGGDAGFRRAMSVSSAIFGADSTGHHYFRALCGNNDALFTTCWILDFLAHGNRTLAKYRETIPVMR